MINQPAIFSLVCGLLCSTIFLKSKLYYNLNIEERLDEKMTATNKYKSSGDQYMNYFKKKNK